MSYLWGSITQTEQTVLNFTRLFFFTDKLNSNFVFLVCNIAIWPLKYSAMLSVCDRSRLNRRGYFGKEEIAENQENRTRESLCGGRVTRVTIKK